MSLGTSLKCTKAAHFVKLGRFEIRVSHGQTTALNNIPNPEGVFHLGRFADSKREGTLLAFDLPHDAKRKPLISVTTLIK